MKKLVIFDFDGVLSDSFTNVYALNESASNFVSKEMSENDFKAMFFGKFHQNLKNFLSLNEKDWNKFIEYKYKIYQNYYDKVDLFTFVPDLIKKISQKYLLAIVSAAPEENIRKLLNKYDIEKSFFLIMGMNKNGKADNLKKCIIDSGADLKNSFFVSDTVGDINEGKDVGLKTIAVSWGFHSFADLKKSCPDLIFNSPKELIENFE